MKIRFLLQRANLRSFPYKEKVSWGSFYEYLSRLSNYSMYASCGRCPSRSIRRAMAKILCRRQICMNFCPVCELSEQISKQTNCNLRSLRRERKHLSTETEIRMTEYGTGCLVRSLAGHDKGTYYIIVREDAHYVYLADGR